MTLLGLMQITTLAQNLTNLVAQFITIKFLILSPHLQDQAKLFLNSVEIKGLKTKYNNEKLVLEIRQYIFKYIQNFNMILTNLKHMEIMIARVKSQFCYAGIKIAQYICNTVGRHPDISKVLKIFNQPEYINVTLTYSFIAICVYYHIWIKNFAQVAASIYYLLQKNTLFIWGKEQIKTMDLIKLVFITLLALISFNYSKRASGIIFGVNTSLKG